MGTHPPGVAHIFARAKLEHPRIRSGQNGSVTFDAMIRGSYIQNATRLLACSLRYTRADAAEIEEGTYDIEAKVSL